MNHKEKILLYASNLWYFGSGMFGPLIAIFTQKIGGSILDISWAWATYLVITGVLMIVIGKISDHKVSKRKLIITGYSLNAFFTFSYLLVSKPYHLFIVQAGLGFATALSTPTWDALYAKYETKKSAGYIWGLAIGEGQILTGIAIIIGGLIVSYLSFNILFISMGAIQVLATLYQSRF